MMDSYNVIIWDFDGVIKDSVEVKSVAYYLLFEPFGHDIAARVRIHHESHGGMSRFEKLPIYLQLAGEEESVTQVNEYCLRFSQLVTKAVIDAPWVPGVEVYLRSNPYSQKFILVSATPHDELIAILDALHLKACFFDIIGAPVSKKKAIAMTLAAHSFDPVDCLMIGDAREDQNAAQENNVQFLLRRHATNAQLFVDYTGKSVKDFTGL